MQEPLDSIFDAWKVPLLDAGEFASMGGGNVATLDQLRYLTRFSLLAPTTHNTVPQRYRLDPSQRCIEVLLDRSKVLPQSDKKGRQALVSVGCAVENLKLAAAAVGCEVRLNVFDLSPHAAEPLTGEASDGELVPVARLEVAPASHAPGLPWLRLMLDHRVVRAEYDRTQPLGEDGQARVARIVAETDPRLELNLITKTLPLRALGKFQEQADRYVLENRPFAKELGSWLLPNDDKTNPRAMRGREFGFDDNFASHVHRGLLGQQPLLPDQVAAFARGGRAGIESSAAVVVLTTKGDSTADRVAAGRAAQRVSLELQAEGFCTAFHAALTEVEWVSKMFAATVLRTSRRPMMLMRVGKVKRESDSLRPHAARPSIDEVLVSAGPV